jgi:hypothetical protein
MAREVLLIAPEPKGEAYTGLLAQGGKRWVEGMQVKNRALLLFFRCGQWGIDPAFYDFLSRHGEEDAFEGCEAALILYSETEMYTKRFAQEVLFEMNRRGCAFLPQPLVEALPGYVNFKTWQKTLPGSLEEIFLDRVALTYGRLQEGGRPAYDRPKLLVLHASNYDTSNTWMFWKKLEPLLMGETETFHVEDGTIVDCGACPYETCLHYSEEKSCFYGGVMVEELLPKIEDADVILWLCPNYNDALSAKLMAVINRMTVLYRRISFYEKSFYGIFVSGNSGGDSVAKQLLGALNLNKGFYLPPYFATTVIANDPGSILSVDDLDERVRRMARAMNTFIEGR